MIFEHKTYGYYYFFLPSYGQTLFRPSKAGGHPGRPGKRRRAPGEAFAREGPNRGGRPDGPRVCRRRLSASPDGRGAPGRGCPPPQAGASHFANHHQGRYLDRREAPSHPPRRLPGGPGGGGAAGQSPWRARVPFEKTAPPLGQKPESLAFRPIIRALVFPWPTEILIKDGQGARMAPRRRPFPQRPGAPPGNARGPKARAKTKNPKRNQIQAGQPSQAQARKQPEKSLRKA
jgi:hypothetical protein